MRLWSIHPSYLDRIGLVAVWREGLLARKVLQGKTTGYRHHPQLFRFQSQVDPGSAIELYLWDIYREAVARGFHFDPGKLTPLSQSIEIEVTDGQLNYELLHLRRKLETRDQDQYKKILPVSVPLAHPLFRIVPGSIEHWERPTPPKK